MQNCYRNKSSSDWRHALQNKVKITNVNIDTIIQQKNTASENFHRAEQKQTQQPKNKTRRTRKRNTNIELKIRREICRRTIRWNNRGVDDVHVYGAMTQLPLERPFLWSSIVVIIRTKGLVARIHLGWREKPITMDYPLFQRPCYTKGFGTAHPLTLSDALIIRTLQRFPFAARAKMCKLRHAQCSC